MVSVSIPYEREGSSKALPDAYGRALDPLKFQFPTNGKGHLKMEELLGQARRERFQFPTNGKGHLKIFC